MKPTIEQVKALFDQHEPGRGGYGSSWEYKDCDDGVEVSLIAEWLPRYETPTVVVTAVNGDSITYRDSDDNGKVPQNTETVEELAESLAESY